MFKVQDWRSHNQVPAVACRYRLLRVAVNCSVAGVLNHRSNRRKNRYRYLESALTFPEVPESGCGKLSIANRVLNVLVAELLVPSRQRSQALAASLCGSTL